jgi:hypothetical protein
MSHRFVFKYSIRFVLKYLQSTRLSTEAEEAKACKLFRKRPGGGGVGSLAGWTGSQEKFCPPATVPPPASSAATSTLGTREEGRAELHLPERQEPLAQQRQRDAQHAHGHQPPHGAGAPAAPLGSDPAARRWGGASGPGPPRSAAPRPGPARL